MKKKTIIVLSVVVAVLGAVSSALLLENFRSESAIIFDANVEALTRGESGGLGQMCSQTGTPGGYDIKLCTNCSKGSYAMDAVAFCNK